MDDFTLARELLSRALVDLRTMSLRAHLGSPGTRRELFAVADLVHNVPEYLVSPWDRPLGEVLCVDVPFARTWLERQLADLGVEGRVSFDAVTGCAVWAPQDR